MSSPATEKERCALHPGVGAVERCGSCGRAVCLECAVPVRGEVRCPTCVAREVVLDEPLVPAPVRSRRPDVVAGALLGAVLIVSAGPWDRFGILTGTFSAWRNRAAPWALVASVLLFGATAAAVATAIRRSPPGGVAGYMGLAFAAALATLLSVMTSPAFVSHTPVPYAVMVGAAAAGLVGLIHLRRPGV